MKVWRIKKKLPIIQNVKYLRYMTLCKHYQHINIAIKTYYPFKPYCAMVSYSITI